MNNDLISKAKLFNLLANVWTLEDVYSTIQDMPPEEAEKVIRCKDCKYWRDDHTCHEHSLVSPMCANEYCSRAERWKENE